MHAAKKHFSGGVMLKVLQLGFKKNNRKNKRKRMTNGDGGRGRAVDSGRCR